MNLPTHLMACVGGFLRGVHGWSEDDSLQFANVSRRPPRPGGAGRPRATARRGGPAVLELTCLSSTNFKLENYMTCLTCLAHHLLQVLPLKTYTKELL